MMTASNYGFSRDSAMSSMFVFHAETDELAIVKAMLFVEMVTLFADAYPDTTIGIGECIETMPGEWSIGIGVGNTTQSKSLIPLFYQACGIAILDTNEIYFTPN